MPKEGHIPYNSLLTRVNKQFVEPTMVWEFRFWFESLKLIDMRRMLVA